MKTLQIFLGAGTVIALLGLLNVATADVRNESMKSPKFVIDAGDGVSLPDIYFDTKGGAGGEEESQSTCAMTPGGNAPATLLEQPVVPPRDPERLTTPDVTLAPISSLKTPPSTPTSRQYPPPNDPPPNDPPPNDPPPKDPPPPSTPEPATLLLMGLGIAGVAVARRRWEN